MHAGVSVGPDGATHQMLEDIGLMRMLPHMTVLAPVDAEEARKAVVAAAKSTTPIYIRFGRSPTPVFTTPETPFEIGKALKVWDSQGNSSATGQKIKVAIMATGSLVYQALVAARALESDGIGSIVLSVPTIKPLDVDAVVDAARRAAGKVITLEEHQAAGGFGSAIAEALSENYPSHITRVGMPDEFGQSGTPEELLIHYGLSAVHIEELIRKTL
jgi:transketolase